MDKIRYESLTDRSKLDAQPELFIRIVPDKVNKTLSVIDSGSGMTKSGKFLKSLILVYKREPLLSNMIIIYIFFCFCFRLGKQSRNHSKVGHEGIHGGLTSRC